MAARIRYLTVGSLTAVGFDVVAAAAVPVVVVVVVARCQHI